MTSTAVYLNRIETAVPANDGHAKYLSFLPYFIADERKLKLAQRLASKCQIESRYSVFSAAVENDRLDNEGYYKLGKFASTEKRMELYRKEALPLARKAVAKLLEGVDRSSITHLVITSCTGFYAPGLDLELQKEFALRPDLERSIIGFMGCYAAFNSMKTAWHTVRSKPDAKVLMVNLELCSLHLQETDQLERILGFLQFADGCAASLISSEPSGIQLDRFRNHVFDEGEELIQWKIIDQGFEMTLSPEVPNALSRVLPELLPTLMSAEERAAMKIWAIHPGGRSILDAVQSRLELSDENMETSRSILRNYGNMSSATIMFVLKQHLDNSKLVGPGFAMAFGPGLTVESMHFSKAPIGSTI